MHLQHPLGARLGRRLVCLGRQLGVGDCLDQSGAIAQVKEGHPAVIAPPVDPAGQGHLLADVLAAQLSAGMGLEHGSSINRNPPPG